MTNRIGFIGLGLMGRPMALNLLKAGYAVSVYARRDEAAAMLVDAGADRCRSPRALAERTDIIITIVSDTPDVEQVVLGERGIIEGARPGSVVVDMSTISPTATRAMAEYLRARDIAMLDAPVSGGDIGAIDGTLSIMVGGDAAVFERVRPVFEVLGSNIVHVGSHGAGQVTKMCNQVVIAQTLNAIAEAFALAGAAGVDPARVRRALLGGFAQSRALEVHGKRMLEGDYQPGFKAAHHGKDMNIALRTAFELGVAIPGAAQAAQNLNTLIGRGQGDRDTSAVFTLHSTSGKP